MISITRWISGRYLWCPKPTRSLRHQKISPTGTIRFLAADVVKSDYPRLPDLCLVIGFFLGCFVLLLERLWLGLVILCPCSVSWLIWLGCLYQCKWLTGKTRLRNDLWCVDGTLNPTHSLIHSLTVLRLTYPSISGFKVAECEGRPSFRIRSPIPDLHMLEAITYVLVY